MFDSPSSIDREVAASLLLLSSEPLLFSSSRNRNEDKKRREHLPRKFRSEMFEFPSSIDREVAASLILLSSEPLFFSSSRSGSEEKCISTRESYGQGSLGLSLASTETRSCESALSSNGSSLKSSEADFMNFKIAKKRRTNVIWSSDDLEPTHSKNPDEFDDLSKCSSDSKEESCLSTGSSEISSTASRIKTTSHEKKRYRESKKKETHRSSSVRRRAVKILEFLSTSCSSEVKIRQVLGDSADTSKALRMLVEIGYVKRSGAGGKLEPFVYKIA